MGTWTLGGSTSPKWLKTTSAAQKNPGISHPKLLTGVHPPRLVASSQTEQTLDSLLQEYKLARDGTLAMFVFEQIKSVIRCRKALQKHRFGVWDCGKWGLGFRLCG